MKLKPKVDIKADHGGWRGLERLHQLSTTQVEARESWGLTGSQRQGEFVN